MKVFSLNTVANDSEYMAMVWACICENKQYFRKFNGPMAEEAMHRVLIRVCNNRDDRYTDLAPYIKKLARHEISQKTKDTTYSITDEESGEVARPFIQLTESFDVIFPEQKEGLKNYFKDMYLLYPEEIMKLRPVFENTKLGIVDAKALQADIDEHVKAALWSEIRNFRNSTGDDGARAAYAAITEFYDELARDNMKQTQTQGTRAIQCTPGDYRCVSRIPKEPMIRLTSGKNAGKDVGIDTRKRFQMSIPCNLDTESWTPNVKSKCDIVKIDISPLVNHLFDNIYVDEGVNTKHRFWLGNRYRLTTLGGHDVLNMDEDEFIDLCIEEFILNLVANNVNNIIGFTTDTIYVKPVRKINFNCIRCKLYDGKSFDLKVTYHITK